MTSVNLFLILAQDNQRQSINEILTTAARFTDTGEQDQYDACESAVTRVLQEIRLLAPQWKVCLDLERLKSLACLQRSRSRACFLEANTMLP
jgi:hypothetical protein